MKVLLNTNQPSMLMHGRAQIQLEQTKAALEKLRVVVEPLRWWDQLQTGDILHYLNRIPVDLLKFTQAHGWKVVLADPLTGPGSRSNRRPFVDASLLASAQNKATSSQCP
jgi:hypothetical protein